MRFRVAVDGVDLTTIGKIEGFEIVRNTRESIGTARVQFLQRLKPGDKFAERTWHEWSVIEIYEDSAPLFHRYFAGYIAELARAQHDNEKYTIDMRAVDYAVLLDRKVSAQVFADQTDRAIVHALVTEAAQGLSSNDTTVDNTAVLDEFDARDMMIREALERLCERTGCRFGVDPGKHLWYYKPGTRFAPWNLSDTPDFLLSYPYQMRSFQRVFSNAANRILVLGGIGEAGTELRVTDEDAASIAEYGVLEAVKIDRTISATAVAELTVAAELEERAWPRVSGRALLRMPPVPFGQLQILGEMIGIKSALYGVDENFQIYSERLSTEDGKPDVVCELEFGAREADLTSTIRNLAREDPGLPEMEATLPPGTLIPGENIVGTIGVPGQPVSIAAENVTGTLSGEDVIVAADRVQGTLAGDFITVDAGTIQGLISGEDVQVSGQTITGAITGTDVTIEATAIHGVIVGPQLADQILDSLRLVGSEMGVVERIPSTQDLPALPNLEYPVGSTVLQNWTLGVSRLGINRLGGVLYEARADNQWHPTTASASLTGILKYNDIESIQAQQITGLIIASQIQNIAAEQITGIIQGDQIGTVNAESITAVNAGAIQGPISAQNITSLNALNITMVTKWDETRIQSVSASSITAGTISALVTMTSPDIRVTGEGYNMVLSNTAGMVVTATGTTRTLKLTNAGMLITGVPNDYSSHNEQGMLTVHPSGSQVTLHAIAGQALLETYFSTGGHDVQIESNSSRARILMLGSETAIDLQGTTSFVSAGQFRGPVPSITATAMPATYTRYVNAYDRAGALIGKIPVI